jgi:hypothetical protein
MPVQNAYFRRFVDAGYRIRVYQSDYINFCQNSIDEIEYCYRYLASSPKLIQGTDLPVSEKAELILGSYYLSDSAVYRVIFVAYNKVSSLSKGLLPTWEHRNYVFTSLGIPAVITQLKMDIVRNSRGRLFFAHLLLPHFPYVWDENCQLRTNSDTWLNRRREYNNLLTIGDALYREAAYRYYFQQNVCTVSLLNDLLESLENNGLLDDATIIIHGDHGTRITLADPLAAMSDYYTDRDVIDGFSTLFAIRSETIEPGYDGLSRSIQNLFAELVLDKPAAAEANTVFLLTGQVHQRLPMEEVPMPEF